MPRSGRAGSAARRALVLALSMLLVLAATGCGAVAVPEGWSAPVAAGDLLLVGNGNGSLSAFKRAEPATAVWTFPQDPPKSTSWWPFGGSASERETLKGLYATPIVTSIGGRDRALIASYSGEVIAVDLLTGRRAEGWPQSVNVGGHVIGTPAFDGKRLYVATQAGTVRVVDAATGDLAAAPLVSVGTRIWSSPLLDAGTLYLADFGRHVRAVDAATGETRWDRALPGAAAGDLMITGDLILVPTLDNHLRALDRASGADRWAAPLDNWAWGRPLVANDVAYLATTSGTAYALELATGKQRWQAESLQNETRARLALVADTLVIATDNGTVAGLDPATGKQRWVQQPAGNPRLLVDPLVTDSTILYTSKHGDIYRVQPTGPGSIERLFQRG